MRASADRRATTDNRRNTVVKYQGQRRYGRKSDDGVVSGRDPAVLPGCE